MHAFWSKCVYKVTYCNALTYTYNKIYCCFMLRWQQHILFMYFMHCCSMNATDIVFYLILILTCMRGYKSKRNTLKLIFLIGCKLYSETIYENCRATHGIFFKHGLSSLKIIIYMIWNNKYHLYLSRYICIFIPHNYSWCLAFPLDNHFPQNSPTLPETAYRNQKWRLEMCMFAGLKKWWILIFVLKTTLIIWENGSFGNRKNLLYKKTAQWYH